MDVFSIKEYQERFDEIVERVEHGETIGIVGDDGEAAVLICRDQYHAAMDSISMYTDENNEAQ
jgi:PHD/YefM family antitoxin component YafN of YafNO toxin-antitoxin module|tara:strand:- start:685 stop:873 length:189 start_codon:yes stop_codon:yes gene_type:complete